MLLERRHGIAHHSAMRIVHRDLKPDNVFLAF
jgi:serine/threonine protein kinase